jgi:hypothetical protein
MSSTRHASPGAPLRQERYASSPALERGLIATAVARRCSVLDDPADREFIWALHALSHQAGGLGRIVAGVIGTYGDRFGTAAMRAIGKRAGQNYSAQEVREIRKSMPPEHVEHWPLKGEVYHYFLKEWVQASDQYFRNNDISWSEQQQDQAAAARYPASYPVADLLADCQDCAVGEKDASLERFIQTLCLDPSFDLKTDAPWYFAGLVPALRDYVAQRIAQTTAGVVVTTLGRNVYDTLDYTLASRSMTLVEGDARIGKSFAARAWCESHPGQARFVEVPTGNDDTGLFRALARDLGLGSCQQAKLGELRERVESVLLSGDLLLCLDEAHRLWPETNFRYGFPKRVNWLMSMANQGVPICLIGTPQFIARQKASEQLSGWNSAQFMGRLGHYEPLPCELSPEDLMAVAKSVLPEADKTTLRALAAYARTSARYLAAIDAIAKRARYIAARAGRNVAGAADVRRAMQESVIPADSKLVRALNTVEKPGRRAQRPTPAPELPEQPAPALLPAQAGRTMNVRMRDTGQAVSRNHLTDDALELAGKE